MMDTPVILLKDVKGIPSEIERVVEPELLPVYFQSEEVNMASLIKWMERRNIPNNREGTVDIVKLFGEGWKKNKNLASLSDPYWIRMRNEKWKDVNFYNRQYSADVGVLAFSPWEFTARKPNTDTPDITTNGALKKRWKQDPKTLKSKLIKAKSVRKKQEPLDEVLVSVILEKLNFMPFAKYDMVVEGMELCSSCDCFVESGQALVPAADIFDIKTYNKEDESVYSHLLSQCEKFNIPGAEDFIDKMLFIDYITGNTDRNLGNLSFLYNVSKKEYIGPAPLYDNGNAYWDPNDVCSGKSKVFGDVMKRIYLKVKRTANLNGLFGSGTSNSSGSWASGSGGVSVFISRYPDITQEKKEALIKAIDNSIKDIETVDRAAVGTEIEEIAR